MISFTKMPTEYRYFIDDQPGAGDVGPTKKFLQAFFNKLAGKLTGNRARKSGEGSALERIFAKVFFYKGDDEQWGIGISHVNAALLHAVGKQFGVTDDHLLSNKEDQEAAVLFNQDILQRVLTGGYTLNVNAARQVFDSELLASQAPVDPVAVADTAVTGSGSLLPSGTNFISGSRSGNNLARVVEGTAAAPLRTSNSSPSLSATG